MDLSKIPEQLRLGCNHPEYQKFYDDYTTNGNIKYFTYKDYYCEINRNSGMGNLCGYIYMKKPLTIEYDQLNYHWGITYDDGQKIGFDCAHPGDFLPSFPLHTEFMSNQPTYKNFDYVEDVLKRMVDKIISHELSTFS